MMAKVRMYMLLNELQRAKRTDGRLSIAHNRTYLALLHKLQMERLVMAISVEDTSRIRATVALHALWFQPLAVPQRCPRYEVQWWASELLPMDTGYLVMFTKQGVMLHKEALEKRVGGEIVGVAY
ncbi:uncharacterized protein LOC131214311 [Anopheles bellator]|uniref:uncharacterized protein LOC131214311 n=1 Tax=Anopheles bellator TaxID=139047 RepID=UPI0026493A60|nr:uncharacterized protein LOC131214311 [Anopheles bellator]